MTESASSSLPTYRMPAEWEEHEATWLSWPHDPEAWPGALERITALWIAMVRALRESEEVRILTPDERADEEIRRLLNGDLSGVRLVRLPTSDVWVRDYGPIFVLSEDASGSESREPTLAVTDWGFNAWGEKYHWMLADTVVPRRVGELLGMSVVDTGMVLEGGSIDADGGGTLLTTESCLLNSNRNPTLDRAGIERRLATHLGARKILWLRDGIAGDDTDGHVDDICRFVAPGTVVAAVEENERDENYRPLAENLELLKDARDVQGRRLEIVELPMPEPVVSKDEKGRPLRCPASYANFYIGTGTVLVPTFRSHRDSQALGILADLFPGRRIVGLDCRKVVEGFGAIHCVTQQQPRCVSKSAFGPEKSPL